VEGEVTWDDRGRSRVPADERGAALRIRLKGSAEKSLEEMLTEAFERTWAMVDEALRRWTAEDLVVEFTRTRRNGEVETFTRAWVVWHLIEHDLHHGGEISQILGSNGIPALEL